MKRLSEVIDYYVDTTSDQVEIYLLYDGPQYYEGPYIEAHGRFIMRMHEIGIKEMGYYLKSFTMDSKKDNDFLIVFALVTDCNYNQFETLLSHEVCPASIHPHFELGTNLSKITRIKIDEGVNYE